MMMFARVVHQSISRCHRCMPTVSIRISRNSKQTSITFNAELANHNMTEIKYSSAYVDHCKLEVWCMYLLRISHCNSCLICISMYGDSEVKL